MMKNKKLLTLSLTAVLALALVACGSKKDDEKEPTQAPTATEAPTSEPTAEPTAEPTQEPAKLPDAMTYAEYAAAELDTEVNVITYVQAKQGWWEKDGVGVATFYTQDKDGGYFIYDMPCSKEDYDKMVAGTPIYVKGFKSEWSGEVEITDATYEILEADAYIADAVEVTYALANDCSDAFQNQYVAIDNCVVKSEAIYKWDGSGSEGDDLYFGVTVGGKDLTFTVESYLCGPDTDVYKAVKELKAGDKVNLTGFLYWYEGAQPHIVSCEKSETATAEEYNFTGLDKEVTVDTYVQAKQGWWENEGVGMASFYTQNGLGGVFIYNMPCSKEDYDKMVPGTKIRVKGFKSEWSGEVEITDATYEIIPGYTYIAAPVDVTEIFAKDDLKNYQNQYVAIKNAEVSSEAIYKWDGSGSEGDDLYFNVKIADAEYTFTVESYLCGADTDVYKAVKALKAGDKINLEGFLYWYEGAQPHITMVEGTHSESNE